MSRIQNSKFKIKKGGFRLAVILHFAFCIFNCPAQPAPAGLYTLRSLGWDPVPEATNYSVQVRTQTNALPVSVMEVTKPWASISNLQNGQSYYLSVKCQVKGVWSLESTNLAWPHPREDYFATMGWRAASITSERTWLPNTLQTLTNPTALSQVTGIAHWVSNNITPHVFPQ